LTLVLGSWPFHLTWQIAKVWLKYHLSSIGASALQLELVDYLRTIVASKSWVLDPIKNAPHAASLLKRIVGSEWNIPESLAVKIFDLAEEMVSSAGKLMTTNCYDDATASGFTSAFDAVLTSFKRNNYLQSTRNVYSALEKINSCQFVGMVCGQIPFAYSGDSIDMTVGILSAQTTQLYGSSFSVSGESSGCTRYVSSEVDGSSILAENIVVASGVVGIDRSKIGSLVLQDHATSIAITNANILWTTKPDSKFLPDNNQYVTRAAALNIGFTSIAPSVTENMHSVNGDDYIFSLNATGKFVVYIELAPESSALPLPSGNSTFEEIGASTKQDEKSKENLTIVATAAAAVVGAGLILSLFATLFFKSIKKQRSGEIGRVVIQDSVPEYKPDPRQDSPVSRLSFQNGIRRMAQVEGPSPPPQITIPIREAGPEYSPGALSAGDRLTRVLRILQEESPAAPSPASCVRKESQYNTPATSIAPTPPQHGQV
jgi:hypothetical protein